MPELNQEPAASQQPESLVITRSFVSMLGWLIALASLTSIVFLFLMGILAHQDNPYLGMMTYIALPALLLFGLALVALGKLLEHRRKLRLGPAAGAARYPKLDFNDPRQRRRFGAIAFLGLIFALASATGSYRAYEYTDSVVFCGQLCHTVMHPEFTAYKASPHARVACVDCHVGPGAGWFVRSKLSGAYQVYAAVFNKFPRPIQTPVRNLRPARETCEQCHWPQKFFGAQLKVFNHYAYDEGNTLKQVRMLINTGGGSPSTGLVEGIHWHMSIANMITYIAGDSQRQVIPWVQIKDRDGHITEYVAKGQGMTPDAIARAPKRVLDCIDCHNRPTHIYAPPDRSVDEAFTAGRLDPSLPYLKQQAVAALTKPYSTSQEALSGIASSLNDYYRTQYPAIYSAKSDSIKAAVSEIQRIFSTYFFPEMKVDWRTHPDDIGHFYSVGCFRCHDGQHVSESGKVIRSDCNICHTVLDQTDGGKPVPVQNGVFQHPIDLGDMTGMKCTDCHTGQGLVQ